MATVVILTAEGAIKISFLDGTGAEHPTTHAINALVASGQLDADRRDSVLAQARLRCLEGGIQWTNEKGAKS